MRTRQVISFYTMQFNKPALSISEQIKLLLSRGLIVSDEKYAEQRLANISYYRLRAYMMPFQYPDDPGHTFKKNTSFEQIVNLYTFDRQLRLLIFDAIERIEIAFRCQVIYRFSIQYGPNWYLDNNNFRNQIRFNRLRDSISNEIDQSREVFIDHYKRKYSSPVYPPAWMTLEILSFGQLSVLFKTLAPSDPKKSVAGHFQIHYKVLESWIESISYIRNVCAHHGRLWNKKLIVKPLIPNKTNRLWIKNKNVTEDKLYLVLCVINYLMRIIHPDDYFGKRLKDLLNSYPDVNIGNMGFTTDWANDPFWQ